MKNFKLLIISSFAILVSYYSCTSVKVTKHPDYNLAPTNSQSVIIYDRLMPTYKFIIIGRIEIDETWTFSSKEANRKIQEEAASIGGDAVIITDVDVDIVAFNRSVTTEGTITEKGNDLEFYAVSRDTSIYIPIQMLYGYVIKRQIPQSVGVSDNKTSSNDYKNEKIIVRILDIKDSEFTIKIDSSKIIILGPADTSNLAWLKPGMDVWMLYVNESDVRLYRVDGRFSKFQRIK